MNPQTPVPPEGQPTDPLPEPGTERPTEPLPPPPPAAPQDAAEASPARALGQPTDFFAWIRSHGIYRGRGRWVGGVCCGIAYRLGVDPLIVRGLFIVLTIFAGIGVLLYGVAWALLPEPDGRIHVQEAGAGRWSGGMTGSLVAGILGLTGLGGGFRGWNDRGFGPFLWTLFWVGAVGLVLYYLIRRNSTAVGVHMNNAPPAAVTTVGGPYAGAPYAGTPYAGTPYGGPPPRGPAREPRNRPAGPGAPALAITAGAALMVGGGLKALAAGNVIDLGVSANAVVWASAAAVLGLGILLAGIRGRTGGILSLFAVVALITGGIYNVVGNADRVRFREVAWTPVTISQATVGLDITAGRGTVDLRGLQLYPPLSSDVVVPLNFTASDVTVVIPHNVPVDIRADMTLGNLTEGGSHHGGTTNRHSSYNIGAPGSHLVIKIDGTVSNVTIKEGN